MAETLSSDQIAEYQKDIQTGPEAQAETPKPEKSEESGHPHRIWDGKQDKWVEPNRDSQGRFTAVRKSLERDSFEQSKRKNEYLQQLAAGAVELRDDMTPDEWAAARTGQLQNKTQGIQPPEPKEMASPEGAKPTAEHELSPEEIKSFQAHDSFISSLAAKIAIDPEARAAMQGLQVAISRGANQDAISYMGVLIAGTENSYDVFQTLGKNPEVIETYCRLSPHGMATCIQALSQQLSQAKAALQKPPKPAPPAPVGARAASSGFDVNDESTEPEEWARQRNKQIADRRKRAL